MRMIKAAAAFVGTVVGGRELALALGLVLLGYGASLVYLPAGFILAGVILVYVAVFGVR